MELEDAPAPEAEEEAVPVAVAAGQTGRGLGAGDAAPAPGPAVVEVGGVGGVREWPSVADAGKQLHSPTDGQADAVSDVVQVLALGVPRLGNRRLQPGRDAALNERGWAASSPPAADDLSRRRLEEPRTSRGRPRRRRRRHQGEYAEHHEDETAVRATQGSDSVTSPAPRVQSRLGSAGERPPCDERELIVRAVPIVIPFPRATPMAGNRCDLPWDAATWIP